MPTIGENNVNPSHVMIAGGGGFVGARTAALFLDKGWRVTTLGLGSHPENNARGVNHVEGLLLSDLFQSASRLYGEPDVIIHAAGGASVGRSWDDQKGDFDLSVGSTLEILEFIRHLGTNPHLILISSAAVYGNLGDNPRLETDICKPVSPYGLHKYVCEELVRGEARMHGLNVSIVRFFSLYGDGLRKQLLWDVTQRLSANPDETLELWGQGHETRDFLYIDDAANLLFTVADIKKGTETIVLNGATGEATSVRDLVSQLMAAGGWNVDMVFNGKARVGDPIHLCADITQTRKFGFTPSVSLNRGLSTYVNWINSIKTK